MSSSGSRSLQVLVDGCVTWLSSVGPLPLFDRILVTEDRNARGSDMPPAVSVHQFQERFDTILAELGNRSWVNLHSLGVQDGALVLAVEYIPGGPSVHEPSTVTVNFSGLARRG